MLKLNAPHVLLNFGRSRITSFSVSFPFEKLALYQRAEQWAELAERFTSRARSRTTYGMLDQLARAANSIPLNVAEGLGKWSLPDRHRFFQIARGSVFECVPIINFLRRRQIISGSEHTEAYGLLDELGRMLTAMIKMNQRKNSFSQ